MSVVFVDASYFIAQFRPADPWEESAREARRRLGDVELVTTDEILIEFLTGISRGGAAVRGKG